MRVQPCLEGVGDCGGLHPSAISPSQHKSPAPTMACESLLGASILLAVGGATWVSAVLCWHFPWLLQVAFYVQIAAVLFGSSSVLFVAYLKAQLRELGHLSLLPSASDLLRRPLYDVLVEIHDTVMPPVYNIMRLILLVTWNLDDKDRVAILTEMSPTFRRSVFRRSAGSLLPRFLRLTFLGAQSEELLWREEESTVKWERGCSEAFSMTKELEQLEKAWVETETPRTQVWGKERRSSSLATSARSPDGSPSRRARSGSPVPRYRIRRAASIHNVLESIKAKENARLFAKDPTMVQKIMLGKLTQHAASASAQVAAYHYDSSLAGLDAIKKGVVDCVTTRPRHLALRVPWEAARFYVRAGVFIFGGLFSDRSAAPAAPAQEAAGASLEAMKGR